MSMLALLLLSGIIAGGTSMGYNIWKGGKEFELGKRGLDLQEKQMKYGSEAEIRALQAKKDLAEGDRMAAMALRREDRESARTEKMADRQTMERMMQLQLLQAIMQRGSESRKQRMPGNEELSVSRLIGVL
jgi:hypothetical protein